MKVKSYPEEFRIEEVSQVTEHDLFVVDMAECCRVILA